MPWSAVRITARQLRRQPRRHSMPHSKAQGAYHLIKTAQNFHPNGRALKWPKRCQSHGSNLSLLRGSPQTGLRDKDDRPVGIRHLTQCASPVPWLPAGFPAAALPRVIAPALGIIGRGGRWLFELSCLSRPCNSFSLPSCAATCCNKTQYACLRASGSWPQSKMNVWCENGLAVARPFTPSAWLRGGVSPVQC